MVTQTEQTFHDLTFHSAQRGRKDHKGGARIDMRRATEVELQPRLGSIDFHQKKRASARIAAIDFRLTATVLKVPRDPAKTRKHGAHCEYSQVRGEVRVTIDPLRASTSPNSVGLNQRVIRCWHSVRDARIKIGE